MGRVTFAGFGFIIFFILGDYSYNLLVPDVCAYHNGKEISFLMKIFCYIDSGGHPEPDIQYYLLSGFVGCIIGLLLFKPIEKKHFSR
jgi:hypothetical protein